MKKLIFLFFIMVSISFALEISNIDPLDFGVVVEGDKGVLLTNVGVYVDGKSGKNVEIVVPEIYDLSGNKMIIKVREKKIRLDESGKGKFRLDVKLELNNTKGGKSLKENLYVKVLYVD
ncbi:MAG: hypothetical protein WBG30_00135 [Psychrilyobacter sp.]|uniref:hypothetical protein n=1 Tax=Psychrilyobacter sp. TaxID=2586924 RepID=UPI003C735592